MEEYIYQLRQYLPLKFADEQTIEFVDYLTDAYLENIENNKFQFAFTAFHMLYMSYMYKTKWFLKTQGNQDIINTIEEFCKQNKGAVFNQLFDLSQIAERNTVEKVLKSLSFHVNDITICKNHVDVRNNCSHASGKIYYKKSTQVEHYIVEEIEKISEIQKKLKKDLLKLTENYISDNWNNQLVDIETFIIENYLSIEDLNIIALLNLSVKKISSNTYENLLRKILYLKILHTIDLYGDSDESHFIKNMPILMKELSQDVEFIDKTGDSPKIINTQKIIETHLIPIITNLPNKVAEKAQKILNIKTNGE